MKIVIAPDSFKESLSADKCCQAIKAGFSTVFPDARYVCLPIALLVGILLAVLMENLIPWERIK
ncbi:hypothetical protein A9Y87_13455 [Salmonella enterica subsp. enterica]|nr:hypothetical protein A9Y87_13455 [Salmonella enterica subsp. enterica]